MNESQFKSPSEGLRQHQIGRVLRANGVIGLCRAIGVQGMMKLWSVVE